MSALKIFTVGPAKLWPDLELATRDFLSNDLGSISHRSTEFHEIYQWADQELRKLLNIPNDYEIYFLSSASEIFERTLLNTVNESSFHFVNGAFSQKFYSYAAALGKQCDKYEINAGQGFQLSDVSAVRGNPELICVTQNETSTGTKTPFHFIPSLKESFPNSLIAVDIVSSTPIINFNISDADMSFFSVQKGMGLPAGLGVWIVRQSVLDKKMYSNTGAHNTLKDFHKNYLKWETPSTPNIQDIYLLAHVAEKMNDRKLPLLQSENAEKTELLTNFIERSNYFSFFCKNQESRSDTVHVLELADRKNNLLLDFLYHHEIKVSKGYSEFKSSQIRISNFPSNTIDDYHFLIDCLQKYESGIIN